jgi:hypothetical protein
MQTNNVVDANYILSGLRQQLIAAGCFIQEKQEEADVIVEPRVGTLGADAHDVVYGVPQSNGAARAVAGLYQMPIPSIPEISFGRVNAHLAVAKIAVFAYDRETREPIWQSGNARAQSSARNTWLFGMGPIQRGSVHEGYSFAGTKLSGEHDSSDETHAPVVFQQEYNFPLRDADERFAEALEDQSTQSR